MRFILPALWRLLLKHHRIVTEGDSIILLFLIPMPICTSVPFWTLVPFDMSPPECLSYWILIQDPLSHGVLLCEWCTSSFSSWTERIFRQFSTYDSTFALMYDAFIGVFFWLLFAFWHSFIGMGSFIFNILFTLLLSMGPLLSPLRTF